MLLKNTDVTRGLANGARGVVIGFEEPEAGEGFEGWGALPKVAFKVANSSNNNGGGVGGSSSSIGSWKSGGYRTVTAIIEPAEWSLELGRARVASRMQVSQTKGLSICLCRIGKLVEINQQHFSHCASRSVYCASCYSTCQY